MNSQHKEKILKSFLTEVIKRCQSNKGTKVNIDPIKVISDELLVSSNYDESAKKNELSNEVTVKQGDRPKIINFFKSVFNPNESSDPSAFDSNSSRLSKSFLPDFLHHECAEILKSCDNEPDSEHFRKELRSLMYQSSNFSSLLDHIVLWIEEYDLRCKKFTSYLGTKKIDLRENTFFSWLIRQDFITKTDYGNLGLGSAELMRNFVLDQKLLGTVCFCDFSTPKVRNLIHTYLKKKYKTDKMPNMFLDLFSRNRSSEKYFGKTVIIFGFYVIFFTFDEFVDYLKNNMTPGKGPANTSKWGTKDFFGYLVNSFQEGINFQYPCSHFRFRKLGLDAVSKKIAIMLWLKKIRAEAIRREKSPSDDLKTDNEVKMLNFVCLDEIKSSRMVNMLRELVKKKFKVIIQPGEGADDFFSITCIPARVRHDRLVLAMNSKYEDNLPQTQKHYSLKCRFSFAGGKEKLRYYSFDTRMICTQELGRNITGLEVILPVDYSVSERQAPRYEMSSDDVKDVALWYFSTYSETPDISRAKPFVHYLEHYGLFNIINISSGGIRISFARDLLNNLQKSFVLNEYYVIKLLLHQEDQLTEVARELRRNEEKPVNNEVYASLMVKNVADSGKEQDPVHVGFQFIQEAHPGTGGRLNWIDIRDKGSWHVGNWLFSRSSHTR